VGDTGDGERVAATAGSRRDAQGDTAGTWVGFAGILALGAAIVSFAIGGVFVWVAPSEPDLDAVRCGDEVMSPGDTCLAFGGDTDDEGIDEGGDYVTMRENQRAQLRLHRDGHRRASVAFRTGGVLLAVAAAFLAVGLTTDRLLQRRRR
jgi:hypothetical protein